MAQENRDLKDLNYLKEEMLKEVDRLEALGLPKKVLIHHSDKGLKYCTRGHQGMLNKHNILPSMTDGYECYQNALAEQINAIL